MVWRESGSGPGWAQAERKPTPAEGLPGGCVDGALSSYTRLLTASKRTNLIVTVGMHAGNFRLAGAARGREVASQAGSCAASSGGLRLFQEKSLQMRWEGGMRILLATLLVS